MGRYMSANILAIANQKGGVGKTTTTVNLAASLASRGKRVLVVDLDPQGNATTGSGIDKASLESGVYQVVLGDADVQSATVHSKEGGYAVLGANRALAGAEIELVQEIAREVRLKNALKAVAEDYDFILIDCPPSLTLLTLNGLVAAGGVIVPMLCEYYALEGISDLNITGIVRTMYDSRSRLVAEVSEQLRSHFGDLLFETVIPRNIRLAEAPSHGMPVMAYDAQAKGTKAYLALADELMARVSEK